MDGALLMELDAAEVPTYPAPTCTAHGPARGAFHGPLDYSLWLATVTLDAGTELSWTADHGDEVLFVKSGRLEHDRNQGGADSVAIIESGVPARVRALEPTTIVHFGASSVTPPTDGPLGAARPDGHGVHVIPPSGRHQGVFEGEHGPVHSVFYADSTCETCRAVLLRNTARVPYRAGSHTHSQDEIIYLLAGDMQVGRLNLQPGMAIAVPKLHRYGFQSQAGFDFINYRRDASMVVAAPHSEPSLETAVGFGMEPVPTAS